MALRLLREWLSDMSSYLPKNTATTLGGSPDKTRSKLWIVVSMITAATIAVSWFGAPPVPALVGVIGTGGLLYWRSR